MTFQTKVKELLSNRTNQILLGVLGATLAVGVPSYASYRGKVVECEKAEAVLTSQFQNAIARNAQYDQLNAKAEDMREQMEDGGMFVMMIFMKDYKEMTSQLDAIAGAFEAETSVHIATRQQYQNGQTCKLEKRRDAFNKVVETQYLPYFK